MSLQINALRTQANLSDVPDKAAARSALSVPSSAEVAAAIAALADTFQPLDSDLTAIAALSTTTFGRALLSLVDAAAARSVLSVLSSSEVTTALASKADLVGGLVPANQLPSFVDDVIEAANFAALPGTGESGKIYVTLNDSRTYRWSGSAYVELTDSTAVWGSISGTLGNQTDLQNALNGKAASSHTHTTADISGFAEAVDDEVASLLVAGSGITLTYNDAANTLTIASSASGISGTLGSTDNAATRADGTGGGTAQGSNLAIDDLYTASPNNTVNAVCVGPVGGTTNVVLALKPKGTGALTCAVPDGTSTGGNVRGANAVDLQTLRTAATQVASGEAAIAIGIRNTSADYAVAVGHICTASGTYAIGVGFLNSVGAGGVAVGNNLTVSAGNTIAIGSGCAVSNSAIAAIGNSCTASSIHAVAIGRANTASEWNTLATGWQSLANRHSMQAHASGQFAAAGDAQSARFVLRNKTTNATPTTLFGDGSAARLAIPSGKMLFADVLISGIKSDGASAACYRRKVAIKNVSGTTSLIGTVESVGTDIEDNASTDVSITADDTNDALQIQVTGIAGETWRWVAVVEGLEIAYGT